MTVVDEMAAWSSWVPFERALATAPRFPGVYMAREGTDGPVVYVGMAGERTGGGRPTGLQGRLAVYARGKGLVSGLGEAVMDRALADADWLRHRLAEVEAGSPMRAKEWGRSAFARAGLHIRWAVTGDRQTALGLELRIQAALAGAGLWNRSMPVVFEAPP